MPPTQPRIRFKYDYAEISSKGVQDLKRITHQIESRLVQLSLERNKLQSEFVKMPCHSGRTLAQKARKKEVENQIESITKEMSRLRFKLKYICGNVTL